MANKQKTVYICSECGSETPNWAGKCPSCGAWNTLAELRLDKAGGRARDPGRTPKAKKLADLDSAEENLRMASRGLEAGVVEPNTALAAHTGWLKAHSEYIDAGVELQLAASNLMKAEGNYKSDLLEKK